MNPVVRSRRIHVVVAASLMVMSAMLTVAPSAQALDLKACVFPQKCPPPTKLDKPLQACIESCQPEPEKDLPLGSCTEDCGGDTIDDFKDAPKDPEPPVGPEPPAEPEPGGKPQGEAPNVQPEADPKAGSAVQQVAQPDEVKVPDSGIAAGPVVEQETGLAVNAGWFALALLVAGLFFVLARRRRKAGDDAVAALEHM
jgi:hypothetical protein